MQIQKYQHIIPLQDWVVVLGRNWKQKESVLLELQNLEFETMDEIIVTLEICSFSIRDKHPTILLDSLAVILNILKSSMAR